MAKISPLMVLPPLIFAGFAVLVGVGMYREDPDGLPSTLVGRQAPSVENGAAVPGYPTLSNADLRSGALTLVNFWASWCPPCRVEHPVLQELAEAGHRVASVNFKDDAADAAAFLDELGNPFFGIAHDPRSQVAIDWGVIAPPETFIVNGEGEIVFRFIGPLVGSDYEQRFLPAFEAALEAK